MSFADAAGRYMIRRLIFAAIGMVIGLVVFVAKNHGGGSTIKATELDKIPQKIFEGTLPCVIEVEVSDAADLSVHFATGNGYDVNKPKYVNAQQNLPPGKHKFTVLVPPQTECEPEIHIRPPALKKGSKISLTVKPGGKDEGFHDEEESPSDTLPRGTAFFTNLRVENCGGK